MLGKMLVDRTAGRGRGRKGRERRQAWAGEQRSACREAFRDRDGLQKRLRQSSQKVASCPQARVASAFSLSLSLPISLQARQGQKGRVNVCKFCKFCRFCKFCKGKFYNQLGRWEACVTCHKLIFVKKLQQHLSKKFTSKGRQESLITNISISGV